MPKKPSQEKPPKVKKGPGRKREKTQISVRVDTDTLNMAYAVARKREENITDVLERGVRLVVEEYFRDPRETVHARWLILHALPDEARITGKFLALLRAAPENAMIKAMLQFLREFERKPEYREALRSFRKKPAAERQPLANFATHEEKNLLNSFALWLRIPKKDISEYDQIFRDAVFKLLRGITKRSDYAALLESYGAEADDMASEPPPPPVESEIGE